MREHGAALVRMIVDDGATVYVCGDGASMARDVEATIKELLQVRGVCCLVPLLVLREWYGIDRKCDNDTMRLFQGGIHPFHSVVLLFTWSYVV